MQFFLLLVLIGMVNPVFADDVPCWLDPNTEPDASSLAALKTFLLPIRLDAPEDDAMARFAHGDYRMLAVLGYSLEYPGVKDKTVICKVGGRWIDGTTDGMEGEEHALLIAKVKVYAREYNLAMLRLLTKDR